MSRPEYPPARRADAADTLHGTVVADPYRWLEDVDDPGTGAWSEGQDALVDAARAQWSGRDRLAVRITGLLGAGSVGTPAWRDDRQFFTRRSAEQEHAVLLAVDPDGTERVLVDPMGIDPTGATTLDAWQPSKEGDLLAYQLSAGGTEESVLHVMAVADGSAVEGPIDRTRYSPIAWLPGGEAYYYVRRISPELTPDGEEAFHRRVWLHRVGTDPAQDAEVLGADLDKTSYFGVSVSMDGRWLVVASSTGTAPRNDLWLADLTAGPLESPALRVVQEGVDASTSLHVGRDRRAYLFTDRDAPRGRLAVAWPDDPAYEMWTDLVPEDAEAVLEGFAILDGPDENGVVPTGGGTLLCLWTRHAMSEISTHVLGTGERTGTVPLPGLGSVTGVAERPEGGHEAWFGYTDHVVPSSVYHYDARTGETRLWAEAPGRVEVPEVHSRQVEYVSADGTTVRMLVLSPTKEPDRPRPVVLYGYGGFGIPMTPGYSAGVLAWVEAGGVYAIANLRGGTEEGEQWHRDGMRDKKQNTFDDLHAAAEHLVAGGWTTPDRLSISGGSNGGLLVGVALTQRPDLYAAVVCSAPLLDMVRYEQFGLGETWNDEYGTAAEPQELEWLLSYSPYHHVRKGVDYPAVLFTVFDGDTRVDPLHARKMCAALQYATAGDRPVLIRRERDVGHGARALSRTVALTADTLAFTAAWTGLDIP
ncbi:MAG TPA: prolyl oligopeptidase family serine peptidase [Actinomycetes bacterium]|jgi:prolyl oligopeptidase|nr:prolyl oligopeptidase family serine peptidase [Actinomycetes bacterium]